MVKEIEPM